MAHPPTDPGPAPVSASNDFVGLDVRSDRPIAAIEWWSAPGTSSIALDNVFLDLDAAPEPGGAALILLGALSLTRRRRSPR